MPSANAPNKGDHRGGGAGEAEKTKKANSKEETTVAIEAKMANNKERKTQT